MSPLHPHTGFVVRFHDAFARRDPRPAERNEP